MSMSIIGIAVGVALGVLMLSLYSYIRNPIGNAKALSFAGSVIGGLLVAAGIVGLVDVFIAHMCLLNLLSSIILLGVGLFFIIRAFFLAKIDRTRNVGRSENYSS